MIEALISAWKAKVKSWLNACAVPADHDLSQLYEFQQQYTVPFKELVSILSADRHFKDPAFIFLPSSIFRYRFVGIPDCVHHRVFISSGTTGRARVKHFLCDTELYETSVVIGFRWWATLAIEADINDIIHVSLFPPPHVRPNSSLIHMIVTLIRSSKHQKDRPITEFFINPHQPAKNIISKIEGILKDLPCTARLILWSPPYKLLAWAKEGVHLPKEVIIMETGGMKGIGEEWDKKQLINFLSRRLGDIMIFSEYGMCELGSQAYTFDDSCRFRFPPWVRVFSRDLINPWQRSRTGRAGVLCVIDPVNIYSCAFIETEDVAIVDNDYSFYLLGRAESCEQRGCALLWDDYPMISGSQ